VVEFLREGQMAPLREVAENHRRIPLEIPKASM